MCHTNVIYMVAAICLLILLNEGWRAVRSKNLYVFAGSAFVVAAYELVYGLIDYKNWVLQNRGDELHFRILEYSGWLSNIVEERFRYQKWYLGGVMFSGLPQTTLRLFQLLTVAAIIYLIIYCVRQVRRGNPIAEPRVRVLIVTLVVILFHAMIVGHKRIYYLAHLAPWFALSVGVMLRDGLSRVQRFRLAERPRAKLAHRAAVLVISLLVMGYTYQLAKQDIRYVIQVRNPNLASFDEFATVLRSTVPQGLCPVAVQNPSMWLAFPESDRCFATLEKRMVDNVDIDGKDYALIKRARYGFEAAEAAEDYHLLGALSNTPYGNLLVYYTGTDPHYLSLAPKRYRFFGELRGYVSDEQISDAREVRLASPARER